MFAARGVGCQRGVNCHVVGGVLAARGVVVGWVLAARGFVVGGMLAAVFWGYSPMHNDRT